MRARTGLIAIAAGLGLTIGGATAYAAANGSPVSANGVVHGCFSRTDTHGSHTLALQDAGTRCPKGTIAVSWNERGPAGPAGPPGSAGPQGEPGPAGPSSLGAMNGTVCDVGSPDQGTVSISYGGNGSVILSCVPTKLFTLAVTIPAGDGNDAVVSNPAGINCDHGLTTSVCTAEFPIGYVVTLTAEPDTNQTAGNLDVLAQWGGQSTPACSSIPVNAPGLEPGTPGNTTCTVTMNSDQSVSATFYGQMPVQVRDADNRVAGVVVNGRRQPVLQPSSSASYYVVPYGDVMEVRTYPFAFTFDGAPCNATADPSAVVTSTSCTFTMYQGAVSEDGTYGNTDTAGGIEVTDLP